MTDTVDTNSEFDQLTAETPRISTPAETSAVPPPGWNDSQSKGGTLNVARSKHIIKKLTDDPSWLIDPSTSHAAKSVFDAAAKVLGMNLQLDRINAQAEAAKARNAITGRVGQSLLKLAESGEVGAGIAAKWYALGDDGKPLYENPANASKIFEDYKAHAATSETKSPTLKTLVDPDTGEKVTAIWGPSGAPKIIHTGAEAAAKAEASTKSFVEHLNEKERSMLRSSFTRKAADADAEAAAWEATGNPKDKANAAQRRAQAETYRQQLKALETPKATVSAEHVATMGGKRMAEEPATSPTVPPMPASKSELKSGQRYLTPRGEATWDGEKFVQ